MLSGIFGFLVCPGVLFDLAIAGDYSPFTGVRLDAIGNDMYHYNLVAVVQI